MAKITAILLMLLTCAHAAPGEATRLLNVSFDVAREFFEEYNELFREHYKERTGRSVRIFQSHAGSSKQARAVIDGIPADVVTMNQPTDIDAIAKLGRNLVVTDWREHFPHNASPYRSCAALMVRKGNPQGIRDWDDLVKAGVKVVMPNPKTSGSGRYGYLGAWAFASGKFEGDQAEIESFMAALFRNVPILDTGGRAATTTFVQRGVGDVLIALEAEILTAMSESGTNKFEIVYPSISVVAEMPVAIVERVVNRNKSRVLAREYLNYLYAEPAQELLVKHFYRPSSEGVARKHAGKFGELKLVTVDDFFGGWSQAHEVHFAQDGSFDRIYLSRNK